MCGIRTDDVAMCWGSNSDGQLGDGTKNDSATPVAVNVNQAFASIDGGGSSTCAITTAGLLYCWGSNHVYQIGNNVENQVDQLTPTRVHDPDNRTVNWSKEVRQVSVGGNFACAIDIDFRGYCWGDTYYNQTGTGQYSSVPRRIHKPNGSANWDTTFSDISAGFKHTCAVQGATKVGRCWGTGIYGELGNNQSGSSNNLAKNRYPVKVSGGHEWESVTTGYSNSCGIKTNG
ncbi:MAG: hypothetical protein GY917_29725, partial [Planctomycetaceae bacterium]|nr:hypothetical protein [Planctomycetaceae bacterium]